MKSQDRSITQLIVDIRRMTATKQGEDADVVHSSWEELSRKVEAVHGRLVEVNGLIGGHS